VKANPASAVAMLASPSAASDASRIITKESSLDDEAIQVLDEEIESSVPALSVSVFPQRSTRSRTPPPLRPRASASSLPPRQSWASASSLPPPSSPSPWLLANRTLELGRAHARILDLEDQIAFRDVRIQALAERLNALQQRLDDAEGKAPAAPETPAIAFRVPLPREPVSLDDIPLDAEVTPEPTGVRAAAGARKDTRQAALELARGNEAGDRVASDAKLGKFRVPVPDGSAASDEDLQRIGDIGPRIEALLRKQGVTELRQIAAWSEADVRQMAKALKIPKSRIVKGRWIETAREMIGSRGSSE